MTKTKAPTLIVRPFCSKCNQEHRRPINAGCKRIPKR